jgi:CBS domain-containing protein
MYPVVEGGTVTGIITLQDLKAVPREEWHRLTVGRVMQPQTQENSIAADAPVKQALNQMNMLGLSRLLVLDKESMVGIITLKDLLEYLALKKEVR